MTLKDVFNHGLYSPFSEDGSLIESSGYQRLFRYLWRHHIAHLDLLFIDRAGKIL